MSVVAQVDVVENLSVLSPEKQADVRRSWYAIRVRSQFEKVVSCALRCKGYEEFLPQYRKSSRWSDRVKEVDVPLFTGYVFCRTTISGRPPLVVTPGVIGILKFGTELALISDAEIEAVKTVLRSGAYVEPWPFLREGQCCRVRSGPLAGLEGILISQKSRCRVVLSVEALYRSVAVEIDSAALIPICAPTLPITSADLDGTKGVRP